MSKEMMPRENKCEIIDGYGLAVFMKMRPSCQKRYALRVTEAKDDDTMRSRLQSIITEIHKYGRRHGVEV
ncbi:hypothetical protein [Desulfocucumis palustris]|uniref:hypothetical protein n=1 Tax=Desulfocucumis palustris TaxID=1898651 RepID=UPI000CE9E9E6|nr:hypothetical protein [Desulfocucumis palustris]